MLSVFLNIIFFRPSSPLEYLTPPPFLKSVWSPLIPSAPGVVVLGWMSALRIRALKRAEKQPKPWNPLRLSFSLSLALIDTVKGPGTGNMSLGIIQRERTSYGRVRADERGERREYESERESYSNLFSRFSEEVQRCFVTFDPFSIS